MTVPRRARIVAAALLAAACACSSPPREPQALRAESPRHLFLIVLDTLRADHLGHHGYARDTSPFLDSLARDGAVFDTAYATASNTLESTFSLFTSNTGLASPVYEEGVPAELVSLQRLLQAEGFNTLAVIANPWLKYHESFFADGFEHYLFVNQERGETWGANTTEMVTDAAIRLLEGGFDPAGRNFFYLHYLDPHDAYRSPRDYGFHRGDPPDPLPFAHVLSGEQRVHEELARDPEYPGGPVPHPGAEAAVEFLRAAYDTEIRFLDDHLRRLFGALESMGVLDDSLVVVTSDHGEEFLEHGLLKHGFHLYDETLRVPLLVYGPRFVSPGRSARLASGVDVPPTLLRFAGLTPPAHMLGTDLFSAEPARPAAFCSHFLNQRLRGLRDGRFKWIEDLHDGRRELYDLAADPHERSDLSATPPPEWAELLERYEREMARHTGLWDGSERLDEPAMDDETREQLESLGYVN